MLADVNLNIQIAWGTAFPPGVALSGETHLHSRLHPCRNGYSDLALAFVNSRGPALLAWGLDHVSGPAAIGAQGYLRELAEDAALRAPDLAASTAGLTGGYLGAGFIARTRAMLALLQAGSLHVALGAENGFLEGQYNPLLKVIAALCLPSAGTTYVIEEGIEYIPEPAEHVETVKRTIEAPVGIYAGMAIAVVLSPFLTVGEDLICFVDFLELIFGSRSLVAVRMILHGFLAKCPAYILLIIASCYSQRLVVVLRGHAMSPAEVDFVRLSLMVVSNSIIVQPAWRLNSPGA